MVLKKIKRHWWLLGALAMSGCETYTLFQPSSEPTTEVLERLIVAAQEAVLRPGDRISLSIWEHDNISVGSVNSIYSSNEETGKWLLLDGVGEVSLPKIGRVKLAGYNLKEATYYLEQLYSQHLRTPIINLRSFSHEVTVLGEVKSPGKYDISSDRVQLVELLGTAQGLTVFADPKAVQVIRYSNERLQRQYIDLTNIESLLGDNVYLLPDDIVYVPPRKGKSFSEFTQKATPIAGILTSIAVLFSVFSN